ncbi:hypothetical protein [Nevskia sp.]|uniref:hypothetical protein n=1 Tax=Nevskia sp. TaxID=1929292 RepID=UPI0025D5C35E|nr:hypothetical protein [Nevskia sp.]
MKTAAALLLCAAMGTAGAAPVDYRFRGYAYDLKSNQYRYTEVHRQKIDGLRWIEGSIDYFDPAGNKIAAKTLDLRKDPLIPVFKLEIFKEHYVEAITDVEADRYTMLKTADGKTQTKLITKTPGMGADSGFHSAIVANFDKLQAGETMKFQFGVAGQLDTYSFRCRKVGDTSFEGKPAIKLLVEPDSLLRLFVDRLDLTYEVKTRYLLEYRGVSNMHDPATGKAYNVRIVYTDTPPKDAPANLPPLE